MEGKSFAKRASSTILVKFFSTLLVFASTFITARYLGPEGRGHLSLINFYIASVTNFFIFGIFQSVSFYFAKSHNRKLLQYFSQIIFLFSFLALVTFIAITFGFKAELLPNIDNKILLISAINIPLIFFISLFDNIFISSDNTKKYNLTMAINSVSMILFLVIFVISGQMQLFGAVLSNVLSSAIALSISAVQYLTIRKYFFSKPVKLNFHQFSVFSLKNHTSNLINFFDLQLDIFIVNFFLGPLNVGLYSVAVAASKQLDVISNSIGFILLPEVAKNPKQKSIDTTLKSCRSAVFILFIIALALLLFANKIIILFFGASFSASALPLKILAFAMIPYSLRQILASNLIGHDLSFDVIFASAISLFTNILLNIILIPKFGISGAAAASLISYLISALFIIGKFLSLSGKNLFDVLIIRKVEIKKLVGHLLQLAKSVIINSRWQK